jgi:hypothetical protein
MNTDWKMSVRWDLRGAFFPNPYTILEMNRAMAVKNDFLIAPAQCRQPVLRTLVLQSIGGVPHPAGGSNPPAGLFERVELQ